MFRFLALFSLIVSAYAGCDNACSGHGTCGTRGICECYDNWGLGLSHMSGDCSQRICPFEISWVDTPNKLGHFHKYAECANRGLCNRDSGDCECFPGYEGKGCQRTTCPNDCSGHGQCTYIQNMPFQAVVNDYLQGDYLPQEAVRLSYFGWDKQKTRGCVCDPEYGDVDCSKRMCPYGTDVMDNREDLSVQAKYQVQKFKFVTRPSSFRNTPGAQRRVLGTADDDATNIQSQTFALTFKSKLNETFTTRPIAIQTKNNGAIDHEEFHTFIISVQNALMSLPNQVIDKIEVHGAVDTLVDYSADAGSTFLPDNVAGIDQFNGVDNNANIIYLNISFIGENTQGTQHLLTVKDIVCADGCTPQLTGLELAVNTQNSTEIQASDFNSFECGRRGKCDYTTGICGCFSGFTGLSCGTINALV